LGSIGNQIKGGCISKKGPTSELPGGAFAPCPLSPR